MGTLRYYPHDALGKRYGQVVSESAKAQGLGGGERRALVSAFSQHQLDELPILESRSAALPLLSRSLELWDAVPNKDRDLHDLVIRVNAAALLLAMAERAEMAPAGDPAYPHGTSRPTLSENTLHGAHNMGNLVSVLLGTQIYPLEEVNQAKRDEAIEYRELAIQVADQAGLHDPQEAGLATLVGVSVRNGNSALDRARDEGLLPARTLSIAECRSMVAVLLEAVSARPENDPLISHLPGEGQLDARIREIGMLTLLVNMQAGPLLKGNV